MGGKEAKRKTQNPMTTSDDWVVLVSIGIISNKKEKQRETERE